MSTHTHTHAHVCTHTHTHKQKKHKHALQCNSPAQHISLLSATASMFFPWVGELNSLHIWHFNCSGNAELEKMGTCFLQSTTLFVSSSSQFRERERFGIHSKFAARNIFWSPETLPCPFFWRTSRDRKEGERKGHCPFKNEEAKKAEREAKNIPYTTLPYRRWEGRWRVKRIGRKLGMKGENVGEGKRVGEKQRMSASQYLFIYLFKFNLSTSTGKQ